MNIHTIQLNIGDLVGGTNYMDVTEFGAYVALFVACYQAKGHMLPDDNRRLALMAKCSPKVWARIRTTVMEKFVSIDDNGVPKWTHERVLKDAQKYLTRSAINSENALKRWESEMQVADNSQCERNATHNPIPNGEESITPLPPTDEGERDLNKIDSMGLDGADAPLAGGTFLHEEFPQCFSAEDFANTVPKTWRAVLDHFIVQDEKIDFRRIFALGFWEKWVGAYPGKLDDMPFAAKKNWFMCWEHEADNQSRKTKGLPPRMTPKGLKKKWGQK